MESGPAGQGHRMVADWPMGLFSLTILVFGAWSFASGKKLVSSMKGMEAS